MKDKTKKPTKKSQKSLYLRDDLWGKIEDKAAKENHSINSFLELHLEKYFQNV